MKNIFIVCGMLCAFLINSCTEKDLMPKEPKANVTDLSGEWILTYSASDAEPTVNRLYTFWSIIPLIRFVPCQDNCGFDKSYERVDFSVNKGTSMKDSFGAYVDTIITNPITWSDQNHVSSYYCRAENGNITTIIEPKNLNVYEHKILKFDGENLWIDWANDGIDHYIKRR